MAANRRLSFSESVGKTLRIRCSVVSSNRIIPVAAIRGLLSKTKKDLDKKLNPEST